MRRPSTLAHEALARAWPRLRSWLDEDAAGHLLLRHLTVAAEDWQTRDRPDSELYRGARLSAPLAWRSEDDTVVDHPRDRLPGRLPGPRRGRAARGPSPRPAATRRPGRHRPRAGPGPGRRAGRRPAEPAVRPHRAHRTGRPARRPERGAAIDPPRPRGAARRAGLPASAFSATRGALLGVFTASPGFLGYTPTGTTRADRVPLAAGTFLPDGHTLLAVGTDGVRSRDRPRHRADRRPVPAAGPDNR